MGSKDEPIVVVGMACRYPGEAFSASELWDLLAAGKSAQSDTPANRMNVDAWYHPNGHRRPGCLNARGGYFLSHDSHFQDFDHAFFGITAVEAAPMDPQQRKLLEVVYECFESAGATLESLDGSETACYVGCFTNDMQQMHAFDLENDVKYEKTGADRTILSNRINYAFNLKGPSMTVDTACSSSLYALHLGCQSLLFGDCNAVIIAGTNIMMSVGQQSGSAKLGILSPTSTCHSFDASADGMGRGDGIGAIYIKKLSDALANKDPIRAIIRSTAINTAAGINRPMSTGQAALIRKAYDKVGLDPLSTGYFELHGTGTRVGDVEETAAVGTIFTHHTPDDPLLIGSIKTNIGHTMGASGIAGMIKVIMALEKGEIPATIGITKLNPKINFRNGSLKVVQKRTPWPRKYRRASVNSFGYGGANAHAILDSAESYLEDVESCAFVCKEQRQSSSLATGKRTHFLLPFFARHEVSLRHNIEALAKVSSSYDIMDLAYTLGEHRSHFRYRSCCVTTETEVGADLAPNKMGTFTALNSPPAIAFCFSGQGSQWPQMGYKLIEDFPFVRRRFAELSNALQDLREPPSWSLNEVLATPAPKSKIHDCVISQTCCTAVQIIIFDLLQCWGIRPQAVTSHSSGEIAAAYAAGFISASQAITIAYYRGLAFETCSGVGAMLAVGLGAQDAQKIINGRQDVVVACDNSDASVTLSGTEKAIDELSYELDALKIFARKLKTSGKAYHSPWIRSAGDTFRAKYADQICAPGAKASLRIPQPPMYSSVTGRVLRSEDIGIDHWRANIQAPVKFRQASIVLVEDHSEITHVVEIGPHASLSAPIKQIMATTKSSPHLQYLPSMVRGQDSTVSMLKLAGSLLVAGYPVDMHRVNAVETAEFATKDDLRVLTGRLIVDLPRYQWHYEELNWSEPRVSREHRLRKHPRHDLLGSREPVSSETCPIWRNKISLKDIPWLKDHDIAGSVILPAAAYAAIALEAVRQISVDNSLTPSHFTLSNMIISAPLTIPSSAEGVEIVSSLRLNASKRSGEKTPFSADFNISSISSDGVWSEHASGIAGFKIEDRAILSVDSAFRRSLDRYEDATITCNVDKAYIDGLASLGIAFGPSFRAIHHIHHDSTPHDLTIALARLDLRNTADMMIAESSYAIHPTALDGCLQIMGVATLENVNSIAKPYLPIRIDELVVSAALSQCDISQAVVAAKAQTRGMRGLKGETGLFGPGDKQWLRLKASFRSFDPGLHREHHKHPQPYTRLVWQPDSDWLDRKVDSSNNSDGRFECTAMILVYRHSKMLISSAVAKKLEDVGINIKWLSLLDSSQVIPDRARIIMLADLESSLLLEMTTKEMQALQQLISKASSILWVTDAGLIDGKSPEKSLAPALVRSIKTAQPSLSLATIDIDPDSKNPTKNGNLIAEVEMRWRSGNLKDTELAESDGVIHVSRYVLDDMENEAYASTLGPMVRQGKLGSGMSLHFLKHGRPETFYFSSDRAISNSLGETEVLLAPEQFVLTASESKTIKGRSGEDCFNHEFAATVLKVGSAVSRVHPKQKVICISPNNYNTTLVVPEYLCQPLSDGEDPSSFCGSLMAACFAINVPARIGRLVDHEELLLHRLEDRFHAACVRYGIMPTGDDSPNAKFDVIIASSEADDLPVMWRRLKKNGRLIIVKSSDLPDFSIFDTTVFTRGASFVTIDLCEILGRNSSEIAENLAKAMALVRSTRHAIAVPKKILKFEFTSLNDAVDLASEPDFTDFILLKRFTSKLYPVHTSPVPLKFDPNASYLLVGGLGGLGRSLTEWMISRGARKFVFLSRSGTDKPEAAQTMSVIQDKARVDGQEVVLKVIRGDVTIATDVERAVEQAPKPLKGVVQASAVFGGLAFTDTPLESWQSVLNPKVRGTINLHQATLQQPLDFFVMTSSSIGVFGPATEGSYAAANAFLDSFARHRWSQGLQATSVSLGMITGVGHVEENIAVATTMRRKGVYGIPEAEFLANMELACRRRQELPPFPHADRLAQAHIVTGLDTSRMSAAYWGAHAKGDARMEVLAAAAAEAHGGDGANEQSSNLQSGGKAPAVGELREVAAREGVEAVAGALRRLVLAYFSSLVAVPVERLQGEMASRQLSNLGMDSMLASEIRAWAWHELEVDVPLMGLLDASRTVDGLVEMVSAGFRNAVDS